MSNQTAGAGQTSSSISVPAFWPVALAAVVAIDDLGGRVNLVGLCQGGWTSAMIVARFPEKVNALLLAGSPIDTDAGDGPIKKMVHESTLSFYEELVELGGGLMKGEFMLQGWKNMHPAEHYVTEHVDLYEHIDDPVYVAKKETFESWYENPIDLRGAGICRRSGSCFRKTGSPKGSSSGSGERSTCETSRAPFTCWLAPAMTLRRRSRFSTRQGTLGLRQTESFHRRCRADTSDSSWVLARSRTTGLKSPAGWLRSRTGSLV